MNGLPGRRIVVTGATGGIGRALTAALVDAGATVVAVGRDTGRLDALRAAHPVGGVIALSADVCTDGGRAAIVAIARETRASMLVLAHAQSSFGLFEEQSEAEIAALLQTNLVAPMRLIRAMLPVLQAQPAAAVVAIGSTFGSIGFPGFAAYSAGKFGLRGLFEALAREQAGGPVRFQYLSPRATRTPFNTPAVVALNRALKTAEDDPADVASQLLAAIRRGDRRRQLGWPEKFVARLNGAFPALVDRALRAQLPIVRRHAGAVPAPNTENPHEIASR